MTQPSPEGLKHQYDTAFRGVGGDETNKPFIQDSEQVAKAVDFLRQFVPEIAAEDAAAVLGLVHGSNPIEPTTNDKGDAS